MGKSEAVRVCLARIDWKLAGILIIALAFRALPVLDYNYAVPDSVPLKAGDEPGYMGIAHDLIRGHGFTWLGRVPLYPTFLAVMIRIFGDSPHRIRYLQCLVGVVPVWLTYLLARRLWGRRAGLLAAVLAAISFPLSSEPKVLMSENLFTPMVLAVAWLTLDAVEGPTWKRSALLGAAIGIADLIRPTLALFPAFLMLALPVSLKWKPALRLGAIAGVAAGLVVLPWTVHNYIRHHAFVPLQASNAMVWQASPEFAHLVKRMGYMHVWTDVLYGPGWQKHDPMSVSGDKYWTMRGLQSIEAAPGEYLELAAKRTVLYWIGDTGCDWNDGPPFSYRGLLRAGWIPSEALRAIEARAIPLLMPFAIVVLWKERRRFLPIYALLAFTTLFHAATISLVRLSEPFTPLVLTTVACAFDRLTSCAETPELKATSETAAEASSTPTCAPATTASG